MIVKLPDISSREQTCRIKTVYPLNKNGK